MADYSLEITLAKAWQDLTEMKPQSIAANSCATYSQVNNCFNLRHYNNLLTIDLDSKTVKNQNKPLEIRRSIIVLHYLVTASTKATAGRLISFKELPGGMIYFEPFSKRAVNPLLANFGERINLFIEAAKNFGGQKNSIGDAGFTFNAFPKVQLAIAIWEGDTEFPSNASILFDQTAPDNLPTEDYVFLSSFLVQDLASQLV